MVSCFCFLALYDSVSYFNGCVIISISFQVINLLKKLQGKKSSIQLVIFKMILINCGLGNTAHLFLLRLSWRFLNNFPRMWCVWCQNVNGIKNIVMWDTFSNIIFFLLHIRAPFQWEFRHVVIFPPHSQNSTRLIPVVCHDGRNQ